MANLVVSQTQAAFEAYWRDPEMRQIAETLPNMESLLRALALNAFVFGAKYATDRCDREHGKP